jgi:uncharacterized protein involved in response to NO
MRSGATEQRSFNRSQLPPATHLGTIALLDLLGCNAKPLAIKVPVMRTVNHTRRGESLPAFALFNLGFRPFFLGAAVFGFAVMALWLLVYSYGVSLPFAGLPANQWHAHEMIYGYGLAVIAGFLLTAVQNWTGIPTVHGRPLQLLFLLWLAARLALLFDQSLPYLAAVLDLAFAGGLAGVLIVPICRARQWMQLGILTKLLLLGIANASFYLGALGLLDEGVRWGLYGGFYLVIGLILTMARRLMPFFIERGVDFPVTLRNANWVDMSSLVLFLAFFISDVFWDNRVVAAWLAGALFLVHLYRLVGWYSVGIWSKPLLWSLYLAYLSLVLGFAMYPFSVFASLSPFITLHAFAVGGIALMTLAMMARVVLGHTGRSVSQPPKAVGYALAALLLAALARVALPLLFPSGYPLWVLISQLLWLLAFALFLFTYAPMLVSPRVDERFG